MAKDSVTIMAVGDIGPIHEPVDFFSKLVEPTLATADIRFGQCERLYSLRGEPQLHAGRAAMYGNLKPHMAEVYRNCGFDFVSLASNHALDCGQYALLDTIDLLRGMGIKVIGAGKNLEEARKPEFIEKNGVKVGMLAYCSVLPEGFDATETSAGCAPVRVHTYYEPHEYQPGMPPKVITVPYEEDVKNMVEDIKAAKKQCDVLCVSMHWGLHFIPKMIADYQPVVGMAVFNAGADIIFGHHAHLPKAIGVHSGKVCFYSLSNFLMTTKEPRPGAKTHSEKVAGVKPDPEYPNLPYGPDAMRSLIVKAKASKKGIEKVSFLPVRVNTKLQPEVLTRGHPRFEDAVKFMDDISEAFDHKFTLDGDEVIITGS